MKNTGKWEANGKQKGKLRAVLVVLGGRREFPTIVDRSAWIF